MAHMTSSGYMLPEVFDPRGGYPTPSAKITQADLDTAYPDYAPGGPLYDAGQRVGGTPRTHTDPADRDPRTHGLEVG